jgi:hypothetical protein
MFCFLTIGLQQAGEKFETMKNQKLIYFVNINVRNVDIPQRKMVAINIYVQI